MRPAAGARARTATPSPSGRRPSPPEPGEGCAPPAGAPARPIGAAPRPGDARPMGLLRDRHATAGGTTYRMREKMFSIGDDYWIENDAGERVIRVDGKALRLRDTLVLEDTAGHELLKIQ